MRSLLAVASQVVSSLRFRLLLLVLLVCTPLVGLMLHSAGEDRRRAKVDCQQRALRLMEIAQEEEKDVIGTTRQLLLAVSEDSSMRLMSAQRSQDWLGQVIKAYPRYSNLAILTTNGEILASAVPVSAPDKARSQGLLRRVLNSGSFSLGDFVPDRGQNSPAVDFGYPVQDRDGQLRAVVWAVLDFRWFNRSRPHLPPHLPPGATWTEFDRSGMMLGQYPEDEPSLGTPRWQTHNLSALFSRSNGVIEVQGKRGLSALSAFSVAPSSLVNGELAGFLTVPKRLLFAEANRVLRRNLTWLAIAAGLTLILGWAGSNLLILRPVKALVQFSTRLASGDMTVRTGLYHRRDELGQLTLAFDQMAQNLELREQERLKASQKLHALSQRLVNVQENERRHIARELHDEIGQSLTAAEMNLQAALRSPRAASLQRRLEQSIQAVERVLEQVHDLSLNLRPSMLDDLGLEPALRWYTQRQTELTGIQAEFRSDPLENRLDPVIETECFRVAQEALTNVTRHAKAQAVRVELTRRDGHLHLSIQDDGIGFDVATLRRQAVNGASLGLLSMEERASLAGGGLELNSALGEGTEVHAWFPLKWQDSDSLAPFHE